MIDLDAETLEDIQIYVNLKPWNKEDWIKLNPVKARDIIDYLVNITKDR